MEKGRVGTDERGAVMNISKMYNKRADPTGKHDPSPHDYRVVAGVVAQQIFAPRVSKHDQTSFHTAGYDGYTSVPGNYNEPQSRTHVNEYHYPDEPR